VQKPPIGGQPSPATPFEAATPFMSCIQRCIYWDYISR
jgi:hypothetical protein